MENNYFVQKLKIIYQIFCDTKTESHSPFFIKSQEVRTSFFKDLCSREISATIGRNRAVLSKAMLSVAQGSRQQMMAESGIVLYRGLDFSKARSSNSMVAEKGCRYLILAYHE